MRRESFTDNPLYKEESVYNGLFHSFDLPILIEKMKQSPSRQRGELNAMILLKSPEKQIVLTILQEGTEINSFQSSDSITLQIIEGQLMFRSRKKSITLDKGQLLTIHENIKYSLLSWEDTVFLLTIATNS